MSIKRICLDKALSFLKASGADYVITFEGELFQSEDPIVEEETGNNSSKPKRKIENKFYETIPYTSMLLKIKPGEVVRFDRGAYAVLESDKAFNSFAASITSFCRRKFGSAACVIARTDHYIEAMRVE